MISEDRAVEHIRRASEGLADYWAKLFRLRRIVLGDSDALDSKGIGRNYDVGWKFHRRFRETYPDILNQNFTEGRNNDIFNALSKLVDSAVMHFPNIEIRGVTPELQVVGSQWLRKRLLACHAVEENKMAVWDHLMGGAGDMYIGNKDGMPTIRWADTIDILFDQTARLPHQVRWKAVTVCAPLDEWVETFGRDSFSDYLDKPRTRDGTFARKSIAADMPFELVFYYEDFSKDGSYMVFIKTSEVNVDEKPVYKGTNPNFMTDAGRKVPFLPFETLFYSAVPGQRLPFGAAEKALPAQIAIWDAILRIQNIRDGSPAFIEVLKSALGEKTMEEFKEAMLNGLVEVEELGMIKEHPAGTMDQIDAAEITRNQRELKEQLGISANMMGVANQTARGGKVSPTENRLIAQLGSQESQAIAKDNADLWSRFIPKFVAKGAAYDKTPIMIRIDGTEQAFGTGQTGMDSDGVWHDPRPISFFLKPDAEYVVTEDQLRRIPQDQRIAKAKAGWDVAKEAAQMGFTGGLVPALRELVETLGYENAEQWIKQQQQPQQQGQPQPGLSPNMSMEAAGAPG